MSGHLPERIGNEHFVHVPYNTYRTQDGYIIVACIGDAFYERLLGVFDHPELHRPEYLKQPARLAAKEKIDAILGEALIGKPSTEWLRILRAARVPCGPVNDFAQALNDPQVQARNMVVAVPLPSGGSVRMPGNPVKLSDNAGQPDGFTAPPLLGAQTDGVLAGLLAYAPERIAALRASRAIA